jgi:hypothetical protein
MSRRLRTGGKRATNIYWADDNLGDDDDQIGYIRIGDIAVAMVAAYNGFLEEEGEWVTDYGHYDWAGGRLIWHPGQRCENDTVQRRVLYGKTEAVDG